MRTEEGSRANTFTHQVSFVGYTRLDKLSRCTLFRHKSSQGLRQVNLCPRRNFVTTEVLGDDGLQQEIRHGAKLGSYFRIREECHGRMGITALFGWADWMGGLNADLDIAQHSTHLKCRFLLQLRKSVQILLMCGDYVDPLIVWSQCQRTKELITSVSSIRLYYSIQTAHMCFPLRF